MFANISSPAYRKDKAILCLLAEIGKLEWGAKNEGGGGFKVWVPWGSLPTFYNKLSEFYGIWEPSIF